MTETTMPLPERRERRGGLVAPVLLIAAGVVLLLNNLGVIGWDVWAALRQLWPVLLIAVGLELIVGRRSALVSPLIALAAIAAFAAGVWYLGAQPGAAGTSEAVSYPLDGATSARIELALGAGEVRLRAASEPGALVEGTAAVGRGERLERDYSVSGGAATLRLRAVGGAQSSFGGATPPPWELRLSRDIPLTLAVSAGAGKTVLDLTGLQVSRLDVSAGVGETELTLPASGRITGAISAGVGQTVVRIPAGVAARIHASAGLGDVHADGRFTRQGEYYVTPGYERAADRVDLEVSSGVGSVRVETLGDE